MKLNMAAVMEEKALPPTEIESKIDRFVEERDQGSLGGVGIHRADRHKSRP